MQKDKIKVEGHRGTWYVIGEATAYGKKFYLLEHEIYGEDADSIGIDSEGKLIVEHIEGLSELIEFIDDNLVELGLVEKNPYE